MSTRGLMHTFGQGWVVSAAMVMGLVAAAALYRLAGADLSAALACGACIATAMVIGDGFVRIQHTNRRMDNELAKLFAVSQELTMEAQLAQQRLHDLASDFEKRVSSRNERLVSEFKVLEVLIRRLAEGIASKSREQPAESDPAGLRPSAAALSAADLGGTPDDARLVEIVRRCLEDNRIDLYLQPIVSLPQRRIRFYEAFTRLRAEDGELILPSQYIKIAEPAGLMSVVDNLLLFRCIQVVRRLTNRNKELAVFCNISRYTLQDAGFFAQFLEFMQHNRDLAGLIIFELSQDAMDACGPVEDANLTYLSDLGFSFSMDKVASLDLDFERLRERRVRYVKVQSTTLLGDIGSAGSSVAAPDLKELMGRFGLSLIAEKVEHEREVVNLLDFNVDFAQGYLFGEPRPLREAVLSAGAQAPRKTGAAAEWPKPAADPLPPMPPQPPMPAQSDAAPPVLTRGKAIEVLAARTAQRRARA